MDRFDRQSDEGRDEHGGSGPVASGTAGAGDRDGAEVGYRRHSKLHWVDPLITASGVVVPARNEAARLPACLGAVTAAAERAGVNTRVLVVLDTCSDDSVEVVQRFQHVTNAQHQLFTLHFLEVSVSNVGAARAAGVEAVLTSQDPSTLWLATTDADSTVPPQWLIGQLEHAARGFDAVVGTVSMASTDQDYPDRVLVQARAEYQRAVADARRSGPARLDPRSDTHRHVHGANLGVGADAYLAAGGFLPLEVHEDVALVAALTAIGRRLAWVDDIPVITSTRRDGRTPAGFAGYLRDLERGVVQAPAAVTGLLT